MGLIRSLRGSARVAVPAIRGLARCCAPALALLLAAPSFGADDFPPPIAPSDQDSATSAHPPAMPDAPLTPGAGTAVAAAPQPAPIKPEADVRIEQKRVGRRISEVIVTPAGFTYQYSMIHLEGQEPRSVLQPHPELSVPRFFRIDF
jgi:hypothetical protein